MKKLIRFYCFYNINTINMSFTDMMKFSNKMRYTKMTVYNTVEDIINNIPYKSKFPFYYDKVIVAEYKIFDKHVVRIWKNNTSIGIDKSFAGGDELIGSLDYSVSKTKFKIEYLYVLNSDSGCFTNDPKYEKTKEYIHLLVTFAEKKAHENGFAVITMDTHQGLRLFHRYYVEEGFVITGGCSTENPTWIEMEKNITKI